jgi:hypothetical protein
MTLDGTADSTVFDGKTVKFKSVGKYNPPTRGAYYGEYYLPVADTYRELD